MATKPIGLYKIAVVVLTLVLAGCGAETKPRMDLDADGFFAFPWPNDIRKRDDGTIDLDGFPANFNPIFSFIAARGESITHDFGTNHGVFFQFSNTLNERALPSIAETELDESPVMLVNIDPTSSGYLQRVPVRLDFSSLKTLYKPANLFAVVPMPGYSLDAGAEYAAILFNGLQDGNGAPIEKADFIHNLQQVSAPEGVDPQHWQALQQQWEKVQRYVENNTDWTAQEVAAFSVYSTQNPTDYAFSVAQALQKISDESIINSVSDIQVRRTCDGSVNAEIEGRVRLPTWQQGLAPYLFTGGFIVQDANGVAQIQGYEEVSFSVVIGCTANDAPRKVVVAAPGSGATHHMASSIPSGYVFGYAFNQIAISVPPHQNGSRSHHSLNDLAKIVALLGVEVDATTLGGFVYYNPFNPPASVGNHIQGASEYIYIRRLAGLLQPIFSRNEVNVAALQLPENALTVDASSAALVGQSQGAGNGPIAMAMDPTFDIAYFNAASSHAYSTAIHRGQVRQVLTTAFAGLVENEINDFHPIMQLMQLAHEPSDSVNFVPFIQPSDLLFTAGYNDGCVPREAAGALGQALVRFGLVELNAVHGRFSTFTDPYHYMESGPGLPMVSFPLNQGNMNDGHLGLFVELDAGHYGAGAEDLVSDYLAMALGLPGSRVVMGPERVSLGYYCDYRVE